MSRKPDVFSLNCFCNRLHLKGIGIFQKFIILHKFISDIFLLPAFITHLKSISIMQREVATKFVFEPAEDFDLNVALMEGSPWNLPSVKGKLRDQRFSLMFKHVIAHFARGYSIENFPKYVFSTTKQLRLKVGVKNHNY